MLRFRFPRVYYRRLNEVYRVSVQKCAGTGKPPRTTAFICTYIPPPPRNVACITGIIKGVEDGHKLKEEVLPMPVAHLGGSVDVRGFGAYGLL